MKKKTLAMILNAMDSRPPRTRIYADSLGRITKLVMMLSGPYLAANDSTGDIRKQYLAMVSVFLRMLEPDTEFIFLYETDQDLADLKSLIAQYNIANPDRITYLNPEHGDFTVWARDCMVCGYLPGDPELAAIFLKTALHSWHNDGWVPQVIAEHDPSLKLIVEPHIVTDGGDIQSTRRHTFYGNYSLVSTAMNIYATLEGDKDKKAEAFEFYRQTFGKEIVEPTGEMHFPFVKQNRPDGSYQLVRDPDFERTTLPGNQVTYEQALEDLAENLVKERFEKPVVILGRDDPARPGEWVEPATDHLDMGCTSVDDHTMAVGDPSLCMQILQSLSDERKKEVEAQLSEWAGHPVTIPLLQARNSDNQEDFDAYVRILEALGYRVVRVPHLQPLAPGDPYITYNNCVMERFRRNGKRVRRVFLPNFTIKELDDCANGIWTKELHFKVIPLLLSRYTDMWGGDRCSTNWLHRSPQG